MTVFAYSPPFAHVKLLSRNATPRTQHYQQLGFFISPAGVWIAAAALDDNPTSDDYLVTGTTSQFFRSSDGGVTWTASSAVTGYCATLFSVGSDVYMFTLSTQHGSLQIRKSTDDGVTWGSVVTISAEGAAGTEPNYYVVPPKPLITGGRVYMPVVSVPNPASSWINGAKLQLCHASTSADLTDPSSWTFSNNVQISGTLINGDTSKGFWEPNILLDQNGDCKIVTRVNSDLRINLGAVVDVTLGESASISYNTTTGLRTVPGGHVFYKVLWDSQSQKYLAISTRNTRGNANSTDFIQRTVLQLISSPDLTTWTHVADIVREPQYETLEKTILAGWQYSDWEFDGNDIVGIIRVGEYGIAINQHQASAIYFVRIKNYYPNLLAAAPTNSGASPSSPHAAVTGGGPFGFSSFGRSAFGAYETGRSIFVPYVVVCPRCLGSGVI